MRKALPVAIALAIACSLAVSAVSGRYIDAEIEVFRSWGFLGLGQWETLEPRLVSVRIDPLAAEDAENLERIGAACARGEGEAPACNRLADAGYRLTRSLGLVPDLEMAYRVVLTNRIDDRLGVVLEIDGLNTNGSAEVLGTDADKKWVLLPRQTVRISGWQVSTDEALAFRFATPSDSHSPLDALRGAIRVHVYLLDPTAEGYVKGTEAAEVIDQPTVRLAFASATRLPLEVFSFNYARGKVSLGVLCEETDGTGVRISSVVTGTVAELRGLRAGDLVTSVNAVPIHSCEDLQAFLSTKESGDRVVLKVHRADHVFLLTLELEE